MIIKFKRKDGSIRYIKSNDVDLEPTRNEVLFYNCIGTNIIEINQDSFKGMSTRIQQALDNNLPNITIDEVLDGVIGYKSYKLRYSHERP